MAGSKTILFIEDDRIISAMYGRVLDKAGYKVDFAFGGQEGLERARQNHYNLILLDIMLPELTGIEILKQLRADPAQDKTKIVILTNLAQDKASQEALEAQADGYLIKADVVPSRLVELIKELL